MISVLIVDDHPVVRKGLSQIFGETPDIRIIDEADRGSQVLEKVRQTRPDVIILDISLPDISGIEVLRQLRSEKLRIPCLVFSIYPEDHYAIRTLKVGAAGYLTKNCSPTELIVAVRKVSQGRKYVSESLAEKLAFEMDENSEKKQHEVLSNREFIVMRLIAEGMKIKDIAEKLSLSTKTVSTYRARALSKMKMKSNAEFTRYAVENSLLIE